MERKQQLLTFENGLTDVPSDTICSDNDLAVSSGLIYRDGEHRPLQAPATFMEEAPQILYVHKFNNKERFIAFDGKRVIFGERVVGERVKTIPFVWDSSHSRLNVLLPIESFVSMFESGQGMVLESPHETNAVCLMATGFPYVSLLNFDGGNTWNVTSEQIETLKRYDRERIYKKITVYTTEQALQDEDLDFLTIRVIKQGACSFVFKGTLISDIPEGVTFKDMQVTAVGKTLIVKIAKQTYYFIWSGKYYNSVSSTIPDPKISFKLTSPGSDWIGNYRSDTSDIFESSSDGIQISVRSHCENACDNLIMGELAEAKKLAAQNAGFTRPFFVRYALRMYDSSYTIISQPVLLFPSLGHYASLIIETQPDSEQNYYQKYSKYLIHYALLSLSIDTTQLRNHADLVKSIDIFVSEEVETVNTTIPNVQAGYTWDTSHTPSCRSLYDGGWTSYLLTVGYGTIDHQNHIIAVHHKIRTAAAVKKELEQRSIFYRLAEIPLSTSGIYTLTKDKLVSERALENITTQTRLEADDYFSRSQIVGNAMFAYNARLLLADVGRSFFEGFSHFIPVEQYEYKYYVFDVWIKTDAGSVCVRKVARTKEKQGFYFYYPDNRAYRVRIVKYDDMPTVGAVGNIVIDKVLQEHTALHGAYYMADLEDITNTEPAQGHWEEGPQDPETLQPTEIFVPDTYTYRNIEAAEPENLENYILVSEAGNPFTFLAKGYVRAGNGRIMAMSTITNALSQGQFGQYPIIAFATDGIWALNLANDGTVLSVQPMSREVCNNIKAITQTDNAIFFSSSKGLMAIQGSSVLPMSEKLDALKDYIKEAVMAYDYRNSYIWIIKNQAPFIYLYNIKTATFSTLHVNLAGGTKRVINLYTGANITDQSEEWNEEDRLYGPYEEGVDYEDYPLWDIVQKYFYVRRVLIGASSYYNLSIEMENCYVDRTTPYADGVIYRIKNMGDTDLDTVYSEQYREFMEIPRELSAVNDYPDTLIQQNDFVSSLMETPNEGADTNTYDAVLESRPMKLENGLALKCIMQCKHILSLSQSASVKLKIYASNNLREWVELRSLRGMPWKYYRFRYEFEDLKATDRFSGTILITEERRTNKLR